MWNAGLNESQTGVKIAERKINNLIYAVDTTPNGNKWRGAKEALDEGEREEGKSWLKIQHQKMKIMASWPIISWQIDKGKVETMVYFIFLNSKITEDSDWIHEIKKDTCT